MPVLCEHLRALDEALQAAGIRETYRGQAWTERCREWVYYDCYLERGLLRGRFGLDACVVDHEHYGTHDGREAGLVCTLHCDGLMGLHPRDSKPGAPTFPPGEGPTPPCGDDAVPGR